MDISNLRDIIRRDNLEFNLYFTKKNNRNGYDSFSPNVGECIFNVLRDLIYDYTEQFTEVPIVNYNPTGYNDETIEIFNTTDINDYREILSSFDCPDCVETDIDPDEFSFYTFSINTGDVNSPNIKFVRRITKFKKLNSKGIVATFRGHTLNEIEDKLLGIDGEVDLIIIGNDILILSHYSLERIFNLNDQFRNMASRFLRQEGLSDGIYNFESFCNDCLNDGRYIKILTKMNDENIDISRIYENHENIKTTIDIFNLDIKYKDESSFLLIYEDKSQIMDILRILRDSYYQSIINEQIGIDDK